jgi:hypothetical protein
MGYGFIIGLVKKQLLIFWTQEIPFQSTIEYFIQNKGIFHAKSLT